MPSAQPIPYKINHEGMTALLRPGGRLWVWPLLAGAGGLTTSAVLIVDALARASTPALLAGLLVALIGAAAIVVALRMSAAIRLHCAPRTLSLTAVGLGGWGRRPRTLSLIDVHQVVATQDGWLVIEPDLGPLQPLWIDARHHEHHHLVAIAEALTEAADRAEVSRGDYPVAETREVQRLLGPQGR